MEGKSSGKARMHSIFSLSVYCVPNTIFSCEVFSAVGNLFIFPVPHFPSPEKWDRNNNIYLMGLSEDKLVNSGKVLTN